MSPRARIPKDDDLRKLLSERGLRVTEQRLIVLRELARLQSPMSHAELTDRLSSDNLDRVTVYRNLLALTEAGLVVKTNLGDNIWRFELPSTGAAEHGGHPHFVCNQCGHVSCLPSGAVTVRRGAGRIEVEEVQLRGRCEGCIEA